MLTGLLLFGKEHIMKTLNVLIVDGQGGGIGRQLVEESKTAACPALSPPWAPIPPLPPPC
jgi:hypothetical protein